MKLQKRFTNKYKGKVNYIYVVTLKKELVEKAGFKKGDKLVATNSGTSIVISRVVGK